MSFNQITPTFCNAMSKFTAALDCALCEVSATFGCIERTYWIMITCSTKLQNCMLNGSKRDILDFGVDFWPERIINPSTGETGLRWHWCPYCAPLWGDQCQAARKYSGKFHYQFVVLLNLSSFFIMLYHKKIATNLSFPSQLTMTGKMHKGAYGEWSFKQRVADQILEVPITALSALVFFSFFLPIFVSCSISGL